MFDWKPLEIEPRGAPTPSPPPAIDDVYLSDQPIVSRETDAFNRKAFANQIAKTLATRRDPECLVLGLYGPWGDGKTSTLNMMAEALAEIPNAVIVRFNPWVFSSQDVLLKAFFNALAEALGKSLPDLKEKIGGILAEYSDLFSFISFKIFGLEVKPSEAATKIGEKLSNATLEELKARLNSILSASGRRVVVLIDDIDRLDRAETQAIFKLVKLSASFSNTSYVLAFDHEMVAAALGERYGGGGFEAGRNFLEKIIQVPLHLPAANTNTLRIMTLNGVSEALDRSSIVLSDEEKASFVQQFSSAIETRLKTPRQSKLYVNALAFALPLMAGEVNTVDLMLLEGLRVFYPKLYLYIRNNTTFFLQGPPDAHGVTRIESINKTLSEALENVSVVEADALRRNVLEQLFPRLGRMGYDSEWDQIWAKDKHVCAQKYFPRYFQYAVPVEDVSDREVEGFLSAIEQVDATDDALREFAQRGAYPQLIRALRQVETSIDERFASVAALALVRNGALIPRERGPYVLGGTELQTAVLVARLVGRVSRDTRTGFAQRVLDETTPLPFALECLRWLRKGESRPESDRILPPEAERALEDSIVRRIEIADKLEPLYVAHGSNSVSLYALWSRHRREAVSAGLRERFEVQPESVDQFLRAFVGEAWSMTTGVPHVDDFRRDSYELIASMVDAEVIMANLRKRFGESLESPTYHGERDWPLNLRIAHQFAFIHKSISEGDGQGSERGADDSK
jgi:predicted KAP-like P-loop ATPase